MTVFVNLSLQEFGHTIVEIFIFKRKMPKEKAGAFPSEGPAATGSSHSAPILADVCSLKTSPELTMARLTLVIACALALVLVPALSKPWYQGGKSGSGEGGTLSSTS